ncbi:MAG: DUF3300 domain-containing protein [Acidobacteriia bacterium]|nr:DUF3300 domain-containing protein [Terriglobia bacterium]
MKCYSWKSLFGLVVAAGLVFLLLGDGTALKAQVPGQASTQGAPQQILSAEQLDDLVAPIALYPDPLLSQVLVACTYPLEVVEAQQWLQRNNTLSGTQLMDAARQQNWDPSVQALVALPDVLAKLNQDVRWTTDLGNAFLAQQADVMAAVQRMRARAQANGKLSSTPQQTVTSETQGGQSAIQIQPANPEVVYVPSYDPMYVWGPPAWGFYPPLYYPAFGFGFGPGIDIGLCFGGWGGWGWGGWGWGWGPNWFGRSVFVNNTFFGRYGFRRGFAGGFGGLGGGFGGRTIWAHDPGHRLGIPYPNRQLAGRFQAASVASRAQRFGGQNSFGRSFGGNRSGFQSSRQGAWQNSGGRPSVQGGQNYRGTVPQGGARGSQSPGNFQGRQSFQSAPRSSAPGMSRGYGGGGARSFGGGGAPNVGGGGARNFSGGATPNFGGGGARSFGGGARSFGGGGARNFSGGGAPNVGGGGARNFSGGATPNFRGGGARSFGGGGARSFSGGAAPNVGGGGARSFGGGGGARSFGGGAHGFGGGGGGGHSSGGGGGGHSSGGGGRRR